MDTKTLPVSTKALNNAHKIAFVMKHYPEKKLPDMITLLELPAIDINSAIWLAEAKGYISHPDQEKGMLQYLADPEDGWDFGQPVNDLRMSIVFCLATLASKETDLEEFFISKWTMGYPVIDVLVSMKSLLVEGTLGEYEIKDHRVDEKGNQMFAEDEVTPIMDNYIFYTLAENVDKRWGEKDFKKLPDQKSFPEER